MMGYLSCKAESSISTSNSHTPKKSHHPPPLPTKPIKLQQFSYTDLQAATDNFSTTQLLGRGSHGLVYKALLNGRHLAVKKPSTTTTASTATDNPNEVENEIDILSNLHSPRLVNLVGFTTGHHRLLVVEFMSNGTLYDVLHSNPRPPSWAKRIKFAIQTAKAIETLHSCVPPVIHRDIKSANVLIDKSFNARLGDFGLALRCHGDDYRLKSTPPAGTMGYLDPFYVTPDNLSTKTDVFSFGVLLLEIISGRKAIDVSHSPPSIVDWAIPLVRRGNISSVFDLRIEPLRDGLVRKQLAVIAAKCVRSCRERRPSMKEVVDRLSQLSKLIPLTLWNGLGNPCLMVENMQRPVELGGARLDLRLKSVEEGNVDGVDGKFARPLRNSRRVYSDLGFRNNLLDLMAGTDGESESLGDKSKSKSKHGSESERVANRRNNHRQNHSIGASIDMYTRRHNSIAGSSFADEESEFWAEKPKLKSEHGESRIGSASERIFHRSRQSQAWGNNEGSVIS